jgi:DNA-binding Lrp family transcriptional regulator
MQTIFIQVKCEMGQAYKVAEAAIENVEQVSEIHSTSGQFDLMIKCYLDDDQDIGHFVTEKIQMLAGVQDTFTLITFKAFS